MPDGGARDVTPPKALAATPKTHSTNFKAEKVKIPFSEFIRLRNVDKELTVSPVLNPKPDIYLSGKKLIISFKKCQLKPNTTYTLDFGNAIADITEGNVDKEYTYVFSTGNSIDSFSVRGIVQDAFTKKPEKDMLIMLYKNNVDSLPRTATPNFLSKTNDSGKFVVANIPKGDYKIFALKDKNNDLKFDLPGEKIAFLNHTVAASISDSDKIVLNAFVENHEKQYVRTFKAMNHDQIRLVLNLPAKKVAIKALHYGSNDWFLQQDNKDNDSINLWLKPNLTTNKFQCQITVDGKVLDTMKVNVPNASEKFRLNAKSNLNFDVLPPKTNLILIANRPIANFDTSKIILTEDSVPIQPEMKKINPFGKFELTNSLKNGKKYRLLLLPKAFTDIQGKYNIDTLKFSFKKADLSTFSKLELDLKIQHKGHYILQLLKGQNMLKTKKITASQKVIFPYLLPGKYNLRLIEDDNNDGKWTTGNYKQQKQPETVLVYGGEINIKANWNQSVKWDTGF